ncbi:MAG: hypothetical protein FJX56_08845 [Alphaproteobacteria bacterium]|nr:hypothetical protein [Alphaproteobacteria bacterium]
MLYVLRSPYIAILDPPEMLFALIRNRTPRIGPAPPLCEPQPEQRSSTAVAVLSKHSICHVNWLPPAGASRRLCATTMPLAPSPDALPMASVRMILVSP